MAFEVKAPLVIAIPPRKGTAFLAGSIDMGTAEHWQERVCGMLRDLDVVLFNPRRDDWDDTWVQDITCAPFSEQVNWELDHIHLADHVLIYFAPGTFAPISLAELGYCLGADFDPIVICPPDFYRRGNVQIMCERAKVTVYDQLEHGVTELRSRLELDAIHG